MDKALQQHQREVALLERAYSWGTFGASSAYKELLQYFADEEEKRVNNLLTVAPDGLGDLQGQVKMLRSIRRWIAQTITDIEKGEGHGS